MANDVRQSSPVIPTPMGNSSVLLGRVCLALVVFSIAWRLIRYALNSPLWGDEAFLATTFFVRDFAGMFRPLEYGQIAPLGFLWAVRVITNVLGLSELSLRLFPLFIGIVTVLAFWRLATTLLGKRTGMLAVCVFSASYFPMRYAVEFKPYGLDLLCSVILTHLAYSVLKQPEARLKWTLLIVAGVLFVWCSYPSIFVAGGVGLLLTAKLFRNPSKALFIGWLLFNTLVVASFACMFLFFAQPHYQAASWLAEMPMWTSAFPPVTQPWKLPLWLLSTHTGELLAYPFGGKRGASTLPFLLACVGVVVLWRKRRELAFLLLSPLLLTFVAAAMRRYPYGGGPRVSLYLAPAFCILIGVGLGAVLRRYLPRRSLPKGLRVTALVFFIILSAGIGRDLVKPQRSKADRLNRTELRALADSAPPGETWITFNSLSNAQHAPNLYAWGGSGARFRYYMSRLAPGEVRWAPPADDLCDSLDSPVRLLVYRDNKVAFPQPLLDDYLRAISACAVLEGPRTIVLEKAEQILVYDVRPRTIG